MRVADELGKTPRHGSNEEYSTFLAVFFPDNMMQIMDYNRLVKDLNGLSMEEFLSRVGEKFEISLGSNQVDFGGMILPASATLISSSIDVGYMAKATL